MKKKWLCALLALLTALTVLPFGASAAGDVAIDAKNFPDENFRSLVSEKYDTDRNGKLSADEIANVTTVSAENIDIRDFKGIEHFTAMQNLWGRDNEATYLDVSKNSALKNLYCYDNELSSLILGKNTNLRILSCYGNQLTSLDLSGFTGLTYLQCFDNKLTSLNVNGCSALVSLDCHDNSIGTLDIADCPNLRAAYLEGKSYKDNEDDKYTVYNKGSYYLRVDDATKVLTEHPTVKKPVITTQPKSATVKVGKKATFKVKATGTGLKYQWYVMKTGSKKWTKVKSATKATLKVKATKKMNGYKYRCKVYNTARTKYTKTVKLKVKK